MITGVALWLAQLLCLMNGDLVRDWLVQLAGLGVDDAVCHLHTGRLEVGLALRLAVETKNTGWVGTERTSTRAKDGGAVRMRTRFAAQPHNLSHARHHMCTCVASAPTGA